MHTRHQFPHTPTVAALDVAVERISLESWTSEQARDGISRLLDATGARSTQFSVPERIGRPVHGAETPGLRAGPK
jgi:hypothetical protein